jgi:hypothetical protein
MPDYPPPILTLMVVSVCGTCREYIASYLEITPFCEYLQALLQILPHILFANETQFSWDGITDTRHLPLRTG